MKQKQNTGRIWPSEKKTYRDPISGATVHQLTNYLGTSNHAYFTNPCWYDDGKRLMFMSDRNNCTNYFSVELASGLITQLTDFSADAPVLDALTLCKSPARDEAYFYQDRTLMALDLHTLALRELFTVPKGYTAGNLNGTADGRFVCTVCLQDLSNQILMDLENGYVGFREYWEARPHCKILKIATDGSGATQVHEERNWLGHINPSPKLPHIMTYCYEGPWDKVGHRIWVLNMDTGETWKLRPTQPGEMVGHEYWMADGEHIGYHGRTANGPVYGAVRWDNTDPVEATFTYNSVHFSSLSLDTIVGDGAAKDPYVMLWRLRDGAFDGPRVLAWHRGSFHVQRLHVHPVFSSDGASVVFTADPQGYGQVFMVELPDFDMLPKRDQITH
jgi:oligogalacturonide lyase